MKITFDAIEVANTNLDMILFAEACVGVKLFSFPEYPSYSIKGFHSHVFVISVRHFHNCAVKAAQ